MQRIVAHSFKSMDDITFDAQAYSRFKYGSFHDSYRFGVELGRKIVKWCIENLERGDKVMISGAPYNQIPVASTQLAKFTAMYCQSITKKYIFDTFKVDRKHSYHVDYGAMSAEEREALISSDKFTLTADLSNCTVIFIDDIVITGTHERNMEKMIIEQGLNNICHDIVYAYYAELANPECCPSIESDLNHASIRKDYSNLPEFLFEFGDRLLINTRLVKFIMSMPEEKFNEVIHGGMTTDEFQKELYRLVLANGYDEEPLYASNFQTLKDSI